MQGIAAAVVNLASDQGGMLGARSRVVVGDMMGYPRQLPQFVAASWQSNVSGGLVSAVPGDLVLVFVLNTSGASAAAPAGWTKSFNGTEVNGYGLGVYWSNYSDANAAINATNFPFNLGYLLTLTYRANRSLSIKQCGALIDSFNTGAPTVIAPELPGAKTNGSLLIAWSSSRDPGPVRLGDQRGMRLLLDSIQFTYFTVSLRDHVVLDGARTLTRAVNSSSIYDLFGLLVEIG